MRDEKIITLYNLEQKIRFLEWYQKRRSGTEENGQSGAPDNNEEERLRPFDRVYINTFRKFSEKEWETKKDICTWSAEELQPIIDNMAGTRFSSLRGRLILLKKYGEWCRSNHIEGCTDGLLKLKEPDTSGKVLNTMVASPAELGRYLNRLYGKEGDEQGYNDNTISNVYRCYFWLAYAGILERDVCKVRTSDVDLWRMHVDYNGYPYPIYPEGLVCFTKCANATYFDFWHAPSGTMSSTDRPNGDQLLRGIRSDATLQSLNNATFNAVKRFKSSLEKKESRTPEEERWLNFRINYTTAYLSGVFYRVYQLEKTGVDDNPTFTDVADVTLDIKGLHTGNDKDSLTRRRIRVTQMAADYRRDYDVWKAVFADRLK